MIKFMLDTNICIYLIKKKPAGVLSRLETYHPSDIGISVITLSELDFGVENSSNPQKNKLALVEFLSPFEILPFNELAAREYGKIRAELKKKGNLIGSLDMFIAAHAIAENCILVTNNVSEFECISKLKIDNWVD